MSLKYVQILHEKYFYYWLLSKCLPYWRWKSNPLPPLSFVSDILFYFLSYFLRFVVSVVIRYNYNLCYIKIGISYGLLHTYFSAYFFFSWFYCDMNFSILVATGKNTQFAPSSVLQFFLHPFGIWEILKCGDFKFWWWIEVLIQFSFSLIDSLQLQTKGYFALSLFLGFLFLSYFEI